MTDAEVKAAAIAKLRKLGADLPDDATVKQITGAIETYTPAKRYCGNQHSYFVRAYVCPPKPPVEPINRMTRPELRTSRIPGGNPRADSVLRSKGQVSMASKVKEYVGFEAWW